MNLNTLATLKQRLGIDAADTADDAILSTCLAAVGDRFNNECNRNFDRASGTTYEFGAEIKHILVPRYPVESVSGFELKTTESEGWVAQTGIDYIIDGPVIELAVPLGVRTQRGRVTYTGGYVLPGTTAGAGQTSLPYEIQQAALDQVAYWYQNRNQLGITSLSGQGASRSMFNGLDLLPHVKGALRGYERWLM